MIVVYASYATERREAYLDWVNARIGPIHELPGCVLYEAFAHSRDAERVVMVEVWETQADFDVFMVDRLMPILRDTSGSVSTPPQVTIYELHNYQAV